MNVFVLGVCGTLNAALAILAKEKGLTVAGYDQNQYPPTSTLLHEYGIKIYHTLPKNLAHYDCIVIGNAFSRGSSLIESVLDTNQTVYSVGEFLKFHILNGFHVLAVSGTHGKSTTSSMLAWILQYCDYNPSFLIGALAKNFKTNAHYNASGRYFVIEADEYDTVFYDKRAKFMHYHPKTLIINNIEHDHVDIYPNIDSVYFQFKQLIKTVPNNGLIVHANQQTIQEQVLDQGCWSPTQSIMNTPDHSSDWSYKKKDQYGAQAELYFQEQSIGTLQWSLKGVHNLQNALAAMAAANHIGITPQQSMQALQHFQGVARRLDCLGTLKGAHFYDDFGHHPTAIKHTLASIPHEKKLYVMIECGSFSMKSGVHQDQLAQALQTADFIYLKNPEHIDFDLDRFSELLQHKIFISCDSALILTNLLARLAKDDTVIIFSSRNFNGIIQKIKQKINPSHVIEPS
jgi:UDP-N-acetylmuramate: L-alanyl-gamma-D-glutamyl-meso-diaminopimelate ligase